MADILDRFFAPAEWKKKVTVEEKEKLAALDKEGDECWEMYSSLEKERTNLRSNLKPPLLSDLQKLRREMDERLLLVTQEARRIREERKAAYEDFKNKMSQETRQTREERQSIKDDFKNKTANIRLKRKEQLQTDPQLAENKVKKAEAWEKQGEKRRAFHKFYSELLKKYEAEGVK